VPDRRRLILILCCLAQFMVVLDVSVVNVALPSIRSDLGFSDVDLQWVVNAYTLTFAGFLLLGGRAADLIGHRPVFIAGIALFGLASLAGGLSQGQVELVIARGAQGLGGAIVAPATLSVLTTTFTEGSGRNGALAAWGAMGAVGGATGGIVGGVLTDLLGWQWILFINVPVAVVAVVAAQRLLERPAPATARRHYDARGAFTVTTGLIVLTYGIVRTEVEGWGAPVTLATLGGGLALLALFVALEARSPWPLMPLRIFRLRTVSAANLVVFFLGAAVFAMWYLTSLYMQRVLGFSPLKAGLSFLPMSLTIAAVSTVVGRVAGRVGPGRLLTLGMSLIAVGMVLFSGVSPDGSWHGDVLVPGLFVSAGIGSSFVTVTIAATAGIAPGAAGLASGLVNTSRQFGGSVGLAVLATVASAAAGGSASAAALADGYGTAFLVGAAFAACGALTAAVALLRVRRREPVAA
jgi:EmrB/QacA subfamily drug resistance transporter